MNRYIVAIGSATVTVHANGLERAISIAVEQLRLDVQVKCGAGGHVDLGNLGITNVGPVVRADRYEWEPFMQYDGDVDSKPIPMEHEVWKGEIWVLAKGPLPEGFERRSKGVRGFSWFRNEREVKPTDARANRRARGDRAVRGATVTSAKQDAGGV